MQKDLPKFEILFFIYAFALLMTPFFSNANYVNCGVFLFNVVIATVSHKFIFEQRVEGKLYIAFFALAAVVTVLAPFYIGMTTVTRWGQETFFMGTGILVVANCYFLVSRCDAVKLFRGFQYGSIPFLVWGMIEFFERDNPVRKIFDVYFYRDVDVATSLYRVRTLFYHPIIYGVFLVSIWCMLLYFPLKNKVIDLLCKMLLLFNLYASQSRSSWVSIVCVTAFYIVIRIVSMIRKKESLPSVTKSDAIIYGTVGIGTIGVVIWKWNFVLAQLTVLKERMKGVFTFKVEQSSSPVRIANMQNIVKYVKELEDPFAVLFGKGYGYDKIYMLEHPVFGWSDAVDNQYMTNLLNYGVLGFGLFVTIVIVLFVKYVRYGRERIYGASLLTALAFMVSTFFYEGLCNMVPLMLVSTMLFLKKSNDNKRNSNK